MDVGYNASVLSADFLKSSDIQVLADHCDLLYQRIFHCLGIVSCPRLCHERIHISRVRISDLIYNSVNKSLELIVLCNEVCLRVYFYDRCKLVIFNNSFYDTLCCDPAGFLLSLCLSVLS